LRNFLIADDVTVKIVDFGKCSLFPEEIDITTANDNGMTIQVDIFFLWLHNLLDYGMDKVRVQSIRTQVSVAALEDLPVLDDLLCWQVIEKCLTAQYRSTDELHAEALGFLETTAS
jgi:hypothetical protein